MKNFTKTEIQAKEDAKTAVEIFTKNGGHFLSMRLTGNFRWPNRFTTLTINGLDILLWPRTNWDQPGLIIKCRGDGKEETKFAMRLLSGLTWESGTPFQHEGFWLYGNRINPCFRNDEDPHNPFAHESYLDEYDYIPLPTDEKAQIALALYREALSLNNDSYKFLSFAKILNVKFNAPKDQIQWINDNLASINDHQAKGRLSELAQTEADIGNYLYASGRCAVAHAYATPLVNPDDPEDIRRLSTDLSVIKALAELMIEKEFAIKSSRTVYREHLYELAGFKNLLGTELVSTVLNEDDFYQNQDENIKQIEQSFAPLSIRLRGLDERPFENLNVTVIGYEEGKIFLYCHAVDNLISVGLALDFKEERLLFDPFNGFETKDNGSPEMAITIAEAIKFNWYLFANGVLEIWKGNDLMGRLDAYLPVNMILTPYEKTGQRVQAWRQEATRRTMMPINKGALQAEYKLQLLSTSSLIGQTPDQSRNIKKAYNFTISQGN